MISWGKSTRVNKAKQNNIEVVSMYNMVSLKYTLICAFLDTWFHRNQKRQICKMCDFNSLPPEMILAIFSFLDTHSLCQASQTCKDWYDFIYNSDLLWKGKCYSLNQEDIKQDIESGLWWRSIFIRNYGTNLVKKRWLEGRYSQTKALDELPSDINHLGPLSADTWGYILDMEVSRST